MLLIFMLSLAAALECPYQVTGPCKADIVGPPFHITDVIQGKVTRSLTPVPIQNENEAEVTNN